MGQLVNIKIKIDDNLKDVAVDVDSLGDAIDRVVASSKELAPSFVTWGSITQIADAAASAIGQLNDLFTDLTGAYAAQSVAETRLAQAMSNTMGASAEEVEAIKSLCSEQQRLGVIGDEVQLAAAQELATYLEYSDSLKSIIPVMNDMAAQQYGLGASAESVTQIATMLGKVMNGQTEALSRYGYKFDEAQKRILQYGTEAERAAVLVDVVSESVGGMNTALAQTPAGKMRQITNILGDWKERLGEAVQGIMPVVTGFNQLAQSVVVVTKLHQAFKALEGTTLVLKAQSLGLAAAQKIEATAQRLLAAAGYQAAAGTTALKVATTALYATLTMGLSLAISAVIELITRLTGRSKDAAGALGEANEASEAFAETSKTARGEIAMYQVRLEDIIKHHKNDASAVRELNEKYGESFGYYNTAESWYKILTERSAAYCRQLGYEAQAKIYASKIADLEIERSRNQSAAKDLADSGGAVRRGLFKNHFTKEAKEIIANERRIDEEMEQARAGFDAAVNGMVTAQEDLKSGIEDTSVAASWQEMSLAQLTKAIQDQKGVVESLAGVDAKRAAEENKLLKQMEARKKTLESSYGLGSSGSGKSGGLDGSRLIENAKSYEELGNNIKYYQKQLENTDPSEIEAIQNLSLKIKALKDEQAAIKEVAALLAGEIVDPDDLAKEIEREVEESFHELYRYIKSSSKDLQDMIESPLKATGALGLSFKMEADLNMRVLGAETARKQIQTLTSMLAVADKDERKAIQSAIQYWSKYTGNLDGAMGSVDKAQGAMEGLSSVADSLSGVIGEGSEGWLQWGASVLSAVAQALPAIAKVVSGNIAQAYAGAAAQSQNVSFPLNIISLTASMAAVAAAVAKIPKFASGTLAYGPTLGIFGEYANAASNPEVVMPADKLRNVLFGSGAGIPKEIRLRAKGRDLVAAYGWNERMRGRG